MCGPEAGAGRAGAEDRYQLQKMFGPAAVIPACSAYRPSNRERFLISCPAPSSGCLTKFQGKHNLNIQRTKFSYLGSKVRFENNKFGSVPELRSTFGHLKSFKILG